MSSTSPRLPTVRREPAPTEFDVEVELCVRVWDGEHGEYHRFEFVATRRRLTGMDFDAAARRPDVASAARLRDTPRAVDSAVDELATDAHGFLARAYGQASPP